MTLGNSETSAAKPPLTAEQYDAIRRKINTSYRERDDWPPYALTSWEDRNRYRDYILKLLEEVTDAKP